MTVHINAAEEPGLRNDWKLTAEERARIDCYCGLGPACYYFRHMTPDQRIACSQDRRQTDEAYWKVGM